jgi:hypothetical protein
MVYLSRAEAPGDGDVSVAAVECRANVRGQAWKARVCTALCSILNRLPP